MKKIETRRPSVLGRRGRRDARTANFTPLVDSKLLGRAEVRAVEDGFPYLRGLGLVLLAAFAKDGLAGELPERIRAWSKRQKESTAGRRVLVKRNYKLRADIYERALKRWTRESGGLTATAMFTFLLESYADGEIGFVLVGGEPDLGPREDSANGGGSL